MTYLKNNSSNIYKGFVKVINKEIARLINEKKTMSYILSKRIYKHHIRK